MRLPRNPKTKKKGKKEQPPKEKKEQPKEAPKKEEAKKEEAKKEEAPKKEKPKDSDEPEEDYVEEKKKSKLDLLPPSKFVLDEWKRTYSNEDTASVAIPWFWKNLDKEGYSIWIGDYKYAEDNKLMLQTLNLVGGYIQRLDQLRKYGFGILAIFGQEPRLDIGVCFVVRGQELPEELYAADDTLNYNWRKIDCNSTSDVQIVNDYFLWSETINGKVLKEAKAFK